MSIEDKFDEVQQLITIGKEKGYLLYDEVNDLLRADITSADDLEGLASGGILEQALHLQADRALTSPAAFLARLTSEEAQLLTGIAASPTPPASARECGLALRRLRLEREGAAVQREIDRLQETGDGANIDRLWQQKRELLQRIATLEITGT